MNPHPSPAPDAAHAPPPRVIGMLAAMCIVVGSTFGIGIFTGPPQVAMYVATAGLLLVLWIGSGLLSLGGAFADAELGAMMPQAGGDYVFQRAAFGRSVAFASGWMLVVGIYAAGLAYMVVALSEIHLHNIAGWLARDEAQRALMHHAIFSTPPLELAGVTLLPPLSLTVARLAAIVIMLLLTLLNVAGTRQSARVQTLLTLVPFGVVGLFAVATLALWAPAVDGGGAAAGAAEPAAPALSMTSLALAYMPIFFAYSGWNVVIYVGGEVKDPGRNIPRALIAGLCAITALYALLCIAFVHALGMDGLRAVGEAGGEAGSATARAFIGEAGTLAMTLLMTVALITATNGNTLTGGRIAFAMARDGAFWSKAGTLSRRKTPAVALWLQALLAIAFMLTGTFNELLQICSIAMVLSGSLNVLALFVLRWRRPDAPRPYRATLYPWLPGLYLLANLLIVGILAHRAIRPQPEDHRPWFPLLGVGLFAGVWLGHACWTRIAARRKGANIYETDART